MDLCNNDIDRDFECFSERALYDLKELFIGKTGIKNHETVSENQMARIFDAEVLPIEGKKTKTGEPFLTLRAKAYMVRTGDNENLIKEIEAGIKKEVSISCGAKSAVCSVCGENKREGHCPHVNGREYDGELAYSVIDGITDAYEFSFVAVPAQREAGVTKTMKGNDINLNYEKLKTAEVLRKFKDDDGVKLTADETRAVKNYIKELEANARLGEEYKDSIKEEVLSLCKRVLPKMDAEVFTNVAGVMTVKELLAFKEAFEEKIGGVSMPKPQLSSENNGKFDFNDFKI